MKHTIKLALFVLLFFTNCQSEYKATPKPHADLITKVDEYFSRLTELQKFNGSILLQKDGKVILTETYNMKGDVPRSMKVSEHSQFDIHSISKLMAKAALVKLETETKISKSDKLQKYIPDFPEGNKITIQHLINNQSGLPRRFSVKHENLIDKDPSDVIELIKKEKLLFEPGSETGYSNLGYQLLYFIIAKITNKPFVQYIDDEFFKPLQMANSGAHFHLDKGNLKTFVKNHEEDDDKIVVVPHIDDSDKNQAKIYSTTGDLLKFINFVKKEPYRSAMQSKNIIGFSGGGDGILSHAKTVLDADYEIVFFSNYDAIPFGDILTTVDKIMKREAYELPKEVNWQSIVLANTTLEKYVGKYNVRDFNNEIFEFKLEQDSLVFYQSGERNTAIIPTNDSTFFFEPKEEDHFIFKDDGNGDYKLVFIYKKMPLVGKKID